MIVSPSIEGTARWLDELLPTVDLPDSVLQWEAQLLANYSGHVFVPHGVETSAPTLWQAVLEASVAQLSMQAENTELRSQNESLKGEQQRLESENKEAVAHIWEQQMLIFQLQQQQQQQQQFRSSSESLEYSDHSVAPPSQFSSLARQSSTRSSSKASISTLNPFGPDPSSAGSSSSRPLGHLGKPTTQAPPSDRDDSILSILEATRLQNEYDKEDRALRALVFPEDPYTHDVATDFRKCKPPTQAPPSDHDDSIQSILEAMRLQNDFDEEDRAISAQRAELAKSAQRSFECGICMEEMPHDSIARPEPCGHAFCRECLRGHVTARINEHRFPILCPICTVGKGKGKEAAGGMW